jgi:hypothetical protein
VLLELREPGFRQIPREPPTEFALHCSERLPCESEINHSQAARI